MKTLHHRLDPEVAPALQGLMDALGGGFNLHDLAGTRGVFDGMIAASVGAAAKVEGVDATDQRAPGRDGGPDVAVRVHRPAGQTEPLPALLWMHGGGWVLGSIAMNEQIVAQIAKDVGCVVASVNYRLAPEHPFPAPLEDCHAAFRWLVRDSRALRVDAARVAVGGASAGGNLAAGLALMARDQGPTQPVLQLLQHSMLDDSNVAPASESRPDNHFWSRENARMGWRAYLGRYFGAAEVPAYAAPIRATSLAGLPPTFIAVGALDMLADENVEYARRLMQAGAPTELHVHPGAPHAFDEFAPSARISKQFVANRSAALKRAFQLS